MTDYISKMCQCLIAKANDHSTGYCARAVKFAVDFGFNELILKKEKNPLKQIVAAKDCGPAYEEFGFKKVFSSPAQSKKDYKPLLGDIAILKYEPYGHICCYTKKGWISDFIQRDMYGGKIRDKNPNFDIYRYDSVA